CRSAGRFGAAPAVAWNDRLTQAAAAHSQDMALKNYFSHTSADGRTLVDRINATGYPWSSIGENIAAGYPSVNAVVDGWIASDGHCANLMNPNFRDVGFACVPGAGSSTYRTYWTLDLAKPG
ncbi:MAG: CAP domain-containing protein, partial [Burkholderiaceae bacterium]